MGTSDGDALDIARQSTAMSSSSTSRRRKPAADAVAAPPAESQAAVDSAHVSPNPEFVRESPYSDPLWPVHLFFNSKFSVHRVLGLAYLVQYILAWRLYVVDYAAFSRSALLWSLPLNGVLQSVTATYYFSFLPKKADPGYYSDKSALSYAFVKENIFYSSVLLWQWLYYAAAFYGPLRSDSVLTVIEHALVFLPYFMRNLVPKTSFRASMSNDANKSEGNAVFFWWATLITKIFYLWAKVRSAVKAHCCRYTCIICAVWGWGWGTDRLCRPKRIVRGKSAPKP